MKALIASLSGHIAQKADVYGHIQEANDGFLTMGGYTRESRCQAKCVGMS